MCYLRGGKVSVNFVGEQGRGMEAKVNRLVAAERRRRLTIGVLASVLISSTFPVTNERALFSPFGDLPTIGNLSPVAYAVTFGPRNLLLGASPPVGRRLARRPPVAYAARFPSSFPESPSDFLPLGPTNVIGPVNSASALSNQLSPQGTPFFFGPDPFGPSGGVIVSPAPVAPVPEPATWTIMISGFALIGAALRRNRRRAHADCVGYNSSELRDDPR